MPKSSGLMNDTERAICARVGDFRRYLKWSQPDLAGLLKITRNQLAGIEYGRVPLRYHLAYRFGELLDANEHWLRTGKGLKTGFNDAKILPVPSTLEGRPLFTEIIKGKVAEASALFSKIEKKGLGKGGYVDNLAKSFRDEHFDWTQQLLKKVMEVCDRKNFDTESEWQSFGEHLFLALEREAAARQRRKVAAIVQANTYAESLEVIPENKQLTHTSTMPITAEVKPQLPKLLERLKAATREHGKGAALAKLLGVSKETVSRWLSGKMEPGGEVTLKLLQWVTEQERK